MPIALQNNRQYCHILLISLAKHGSITYVLCKTIGNIPCIAVQFAIGIFHVLLCKYMAYSMYCCSNNMAYSMYCIAKHGIFHISHSNRQYAMFCKTIGNIAIFCIAKHGILPYFALQIHDILQYCHVLQNNRQYCHILHCNLNIDNMACLLPCNRQ